MDPLHIRRQAHRLTLMYKIANNYIDIDPHTYLHNTNNQRTRNTHNHTYQTYYTNTDSYKHSYFPRTIRDWNRLPHLILNSNTIDSFTKQIHMHLSPQHWHTHLIHFPPIRGVESESRSRLLLAGVGVGVGIGVRVGVGVGIGVRVGVGKNMSDSVASSLSLRN